MKWGGEVQKVSGPKAAKTKTTTTFNLTPTSPRHISKIEFRRPPQTSENYEVVMGIVGLPHERINSISRTRNKGVQAGRRREVELSWG